MKRYNVYQALTGEPMTKRDKEEVGSPFWNEGKFNNFVKPFLKKEFEHQTFIDMGCNAGLFVKLAEEMGFHGIGVDSDKAAIERGLAWRDKQGGHYKLFQFGMEHSLDTLPLADYTTFVNAHYYFTVNDWLEHVDKLEYKTRYAIIVTDEKKHLQRCWASADVNDIRSVFRNWEEVGFIDALPQVGANPRKLRALCFKSRHIDKVPAASLDSSNHVQDKFWKEIDEGKHYTETKYYRILSGYRKEWTKEYLHQWLEERIKNYLDVKENGMRVPIIIDRDNRILDGNHRYSGLVSLGVKDVFVRKI